MNEKMRSRGIRDIAHLYLSRKTGAAPPALDLWVCAENRACMPGYHVANIAAAMASGGRRVRIVERSGVLPNAAVFLNLPPAVYLGDDGSAPVPAMSSISVCFEDAAKPPAPAINLIHLPPIEDEASFDAAARAVDTILPGERKRAGLLLRRRPPEEPGAFPGAWVDAWSVYQLALENLPVGEHVRGHLGSIGGWQSTVNDRAPRVVRDPDSELARAYLSVGESLLARLNSPRSGAGAPARRPMATHPAQHTMRTISGGRPHRQRSWQADRREAGGHPGKREGATDEERRRRAPRYAESETPR